MCCQQTREEGSVTRCLLINNFDFYPLEEPNKPYGYISTRRHMSTSHSIQYRLSLLCDNVSIAQPTTMGCSAVLIRLSDNHAFTLHFKCIFLSNLCVCVRCRLIWNNQYNCVKLTINDNNNNNIMDNMVITHFNIFGETQSSLMRPTNLAKSERKSINH